MAKLSTVAVALCVFAAIFVLYKLNLPEGWPRFVGAGVIVAAFFIVLYFARRAYNNPNRK